MIRALLATSLTVAILLPLLVWPQGLLFPFVTTKGLALQALAATALLGLGARVLVPGASRVARDGIATALAAVLTVMLVTGLAAGLLERALLDDLERMTGAVTVACALVVLLLARHVAVTEAQRLRWLAAAASVAVPVLAVAVLQKGGAEVLALAHRDRPPSTLGHPAYLAAHGLFAVFSGATVALAAERRGLRIVGGIAALAGLGCVVVSEARSAALGLIAGGLVVLYVRAVRAPRGGRERRALQWVVSVATLILAASIFVAKSPWAGDVPIVRRVAGISWEGGTVATRLLVWDASVDAWLERPWLGWGPGSFPAAFEAHYRPALLRFGLPETWFDDAHDVLLNTLVEQGLLGAVALGVLVSAAIRCAAFGERARRDRLTATAVPLGFVVAHFVDKLFVFETVVSWVQLALFLGLALPVPRSEPGRRGAGRAATAVALVACSATLVMLALVPQALAAHRARTAAGLFATGDAAAADELDAAIAAAPAHAGEVTRVLCASAAQTMPRVPSRGDDAPASALAQHVLARQRECSDRPVRDALTRAYLVLAIPELRRSDRLLRTMGTELGEAAEGSPLRQEIALLRADVLTRLDRSDDAERLLAGARDVDRTVPAPWMWLIRHLARTRGAEAGRNERASARREGVTFSTAEEALLESWLRE